MFNPLWLESKKSVWRRAEQWSRFEAYRADLVVDMVMIILVNSESPVTQRESVLILFGERIISPLIIGLKLFYEQRQTERLWCQLYYLLLWFYDFPWQSLINDHCWSWDSGPTQAHPVVTTSLSHEHEPSVDQEKCSHHHQQSRWTLPVIFKVKTTNYNVS